MRGIRVEVAYARPDAHTVIELELMPNASVADAIRQSGVLSQFPEIDLGIDRVGVFGALAKLEDRVSDGDRVEIYRKLQADPKEARRRRAGKRVPKRPST